MSADPSATDSTGPSPVVLEARGCTLSHVHLLRVGSFRTEARRIACVGTAQLLVHALGNPELIKEGQLLIDDRTPASLLRDCLAAYVPKSLPLPPSTKVRDAIYLSARLVGMGRVDAEQALSRCRMSAHSGKKLAELTRLQSRLVSLAHGLLGSPPLLILENLYEDLDEPEIEIAETILDVELDQRATIFALDLKSPACRGILMRSDQVLLGAGEQVLPPEPPAQIPSDGYWVTCTSDAKEMAGVLTLSGARVTRSPRTSVLFIRGTDSQAIYQAARVTGTAIVELCPHPSESFPATRATSGA